jgi:hypothetical protein
MVKLPCTVVAPLIAPVEVCVPDGAQVKLLKLPVIPVGLVVVVPVILTVEVVIGELVPLAA